MKPFPSRGRPRLAHDLHSPLMQEFEHLLLSSPHALVELADFAGVNYRTWCAWRNQRKTPNIDIFNASLAAFGYKLSIVPLTLPYSDPLNPMEKPHA